jgi:hypothetical protein
VAAVAARRVTARSAARLAATGLATVVIAGSSAAPALAADILGLNTPPVTLPDAYVTTRGHELNVSIAQGVLANDLDVDGDELKSRDDDSLAPRHGDVNLDNEGSFRYRPDAGYVGIDTFGYLADDGNVKVPAIVTITILPLATPSPPPTKAPPTPSPTPDPTPAPTATAAPTARPTTAPTVAPTQPGLPTLLPTSLPTLLPTRAPSAAPATSATPMPTSKPSDVPAGPRDGPATPRPSSAPGGALTGGTSSGGSNGGATGGAGGTGRGDGNAGPPRELTVPVGGSGTGAGAVELAAAPISFSGGAFAWAVPGMVLAVPGLLVVLAVSLQVIAGAAWLPVVRRRLGGGQTARVRRVSMAPSDDRPSGRS